MRFLHLMVAAVVVVSAARAAATNIPTEPIAPIGCATTYIAPDDSLPPTDSLEVSISASRRWGVVPFDVQLDVVISAGADSILSVAWDFDADSLADAFGAPVSHVFADPIDYGVTADITTLGHGMLRRSAAISGHSALMTLTFDDGQMSVIEVALPLLLGKGVTATAYIVPDWVCRSWYMAWAHLHFLEDFGWDIESHGLTHVDLTKVDSLTLDHELSRSRAELQAQGFDPKHFAPPFGACNWAVINAAKRYYESCRNWRGLNPRVEQVDPYQIRWQVTSANKPFSDYQALMDSVIASSGWLVLNNHIVDGTCSGLPSCVKTEMLADIIDYASANRIKIVNIEEALSSVEAPARRLDLPAQPAAAAPEGCSLSLSGVPVWSFPVTVDFKVPAGTGAEISIYDARGRLVGSLARVTGGRDACRVVWDGQNLSGTPVASGCYFCVLRSGKDTLLTRKIVVTR